MQALQKVGFLVVRQRGSHVQVRRTEADGSVTTFPVPVHVGQMLKKGTLPGILRKSPSGRGPTRRTALAGRPTISYDPLATPLADRRSPRLPGPGPRSRKVAVTGRCRSARRRPAPVPRDRPAAAP
ncbi:MAG: type II toxin-antitoxin system HicA family toxin [Candidatus Latescibacterota bacterium]